MFFKFILWGRGICMCIFTCGCVEGYFGCGKFFCGGRAFVALVISCECIYIYGVVKKCMMLSCYC